MNKIKVTADEPKYDIPNRVIVTNRKCKVCAIKFYYGSGAGLVITSPKVTTNNHPDNNACSSCQFWTEVLSNDQAEDSHAVVINSEHYIYGNEVEGVKATPEDNLTRIYYKIKAQKKGQGMGGDPHVIRKADGEIIITTDLWHQGTVPASFAEVLPNNAEFVSL